jgi:GMP synthase (glutamine-hydrolysing)
VDAPRVLVVQHVPWEGPHRIGRALEAAGLELDIRLPLDGEELPALDEVAGAVFMGGPMNVDEIDRYPGLLAEREWLTEAIGADLPVLGVCLGSQLIARAVGAEIRPGPAPEIGWAPVWIHDAEDPIVGALSPGTPVLHWHGDIFDLPPGATHLASSDRTATQAFRVRNAWGLLFHAEADAELAESWLGESSMGDEAAHTLGPEGPAAIAADAREFAPQLIAASTPGFAAFAELIASRASD